MILRFEACRVDLHFQRHFMQDVLLSSVLELGRNIRENHQILPIQNHYVHSKKSQHKKLLFEKKGDIVVYTK